MHNRRLEFVFTVLLHSSQNDEKDLFCLRFLFDSVGLIGPDSNSHIVAEELWYLGSGFDDLLTLICGDDFSMIRGINVVILCEMSVHNIKQNKMFIPYVFIMFTYEMSSSCSNSEARLTTKK